MVGQVLMVGGSRDGEFLEYDGETGSFADVCSFLCTTKPAGGKEKYIRLPVSTSDGESILFHESMSLADVHKWVTQKRKEPCST